MNDMSVSLGIENYYEIYGEGQPILFIHGSYASTSTWKKLVEELSKNHKCILFKLPGHCGLPDPVDFDKPTVKTEFALLDGIIQKECPQGFHLVGHSYGGVVALALALEQIWPVLGMTLYEPVSTWVLDLVQEKKALQLLRDFLNDYIPKAKQGMPVGGDVIDFWCHAPVFNHFPEGVREQLLLLQKNNLRHWSICTQASYNQDNLNALSIPVSLVVGSESSPVAHAIIHALEHLLPSAEARCIQGANHLLVTTHKDACLAAMW